MTRKVETLRVVWKIIRRTGYPSTRTAETYCDYIVENNNHKHRLKTYERTELFKLLQSTRISKDNKFIGSLLVDGIYINGKLISITNPRKI
jgi:hypothetical protein